jgi:hypothetical protein
MRPICSSAAIALSLALCTAAFAQVKQDPATHGQPAPVDPALMKPLPELPGVVSWKTLAQVQPAKEKDKFVPQFDKAVVALDKKEVKLQGFMMPLEMGERQKHFILTALPPSCSFCMPGGPESVVEVRTKQPVKYTMEPIILSGKLAVLRDDPTGIYYRLVDATPSKAAK